MSTSIRIVPVVSKKDRKRFHALPWSIYRGMPHWVPPLLMDVERRLDPKVNPFFDHATVDLYLAERDGKVVGRIAAITDQRHEEKYKDGVGFFGWYESIDDADVARALFDRVKARLTELKKTIIRGPVNSSMNEECGLLMDGFDRDSVIMMPYNPPYYERLFLANGVQKVMDLYSYLLPVASFGATRMERIVTKVKERERLTVRSFNKSRFHEELENLKSIYNDAWTDNWGFVPLTDRELEHMANDLKPILEPKLACFVEVDGRPVGFSLVLPNINEILKTLDGKLFPFGIFKILFGVKKIQSIRLLAMGIRREYHHRGLDAVLYFDNFRASQALGKTMSDIGWILESNQVMINTIERIGGTRYKTHRMFEGAL